MVLMPEEDVVRDKQNTELQVENHKANAPSKDIVAASENAFAFVGKENTFIEIRSSQGSEEKSFLSDSVLLNSVESVGRVMPENTQNAAIEEIGGDMYIDFMAPTLEDSGDEQEPSNEVLHVGSGSEDIGVTKDLDDMEQNLAVDLDEREQNLAVSSPGRRLKQRGSLLGHGLHGKKVVEMLLETGGDDGVLQFCQMWRSVFVESLKPTHLPTGWDILHSGHRDFGEYSIYKPSRNE